ncbi:MAG TPA: transposase family protein [Ktedonobacteraceae bacterium]
MRYSVALILTLVVLGKMMGVTTPAARAQWVRLRGRWLSRVLPITRQAFPCAATSRNVLRAVDAEQVNHVLTQALTCVRAMERCGEEPSRLRGQAEREEQAKPCLSLEIFGETVLHFVNM